MFIDAIQKRFANHVEQSLLRTRNIIARLSGNSIAVNGIRCLDFSSNDYLGLKKHPKITSAFIDAVQKYGFGSGASVFISGYSDAHAEIEYLFSKWLGVNKAILFNSGYSANLGVINALSNKSMTIFSDKLCHASLLDGIVLSRAKHYRYQHCNTEHLKYLTQYKKPNLIVTESIFSTSGSIAPILSLAKLAKQYQSELLIDDAHGIGVLGETGAGIAEQYNLNQQSYSCLALPLGKAFNALGAIVAGKSSIIEAVLQFAKTYCYTTAIPPAICRTIKMSLQIIQEEKWRRDKLTENIHFFISYAREKNLKLNANDITPIKAVSVHNNKTVLALQDFLLTKGFYVSAIRPPTVPKNKANLRISLNCLHTHDEIMQLIDNIIIGQKKCMHIFR